MGKLVSKKSNWIGRLFERKRIGKERENSPLPPSWVHGLRAGLVETRGFVPDVPFGFFFSSFLLIVAAALFVVLFF